MNLHHHLHNYQHRGNMILFPISAVIEIYGLFRHGVRQTKYGRINGDPVETILKFAQSCWSNSKADQKYSSLQGCEHWKCKTIKNNHRVRKKMLNHGFDTPLVLSDDLQNKIIAE